MNFRTKSESSPHTAIDNEHADNLEEQPDELLPGLVQVLKDSERPLEY